MPAGASRSMRANSVVAIGAIASPVKSSRTAITVMEPAKASGAAPRARTPTRTSRRRSSGARQPTEPYQSPPRSDPSAHTANSGPAAARDPSLSVKAGSATSTAP